MQLPPLIRCRVGVILASMALALTPCAPTVAHAATAIDKSETVHVQTDATGTVTQITVDTQLANATHASTLADRSTLTDIAPQDEEQTFVKGSDGTLTWSTGGRTVGYKGTSSAQPPIDVKVSYHLDGVERTPDQLVGASGHLALRIDYTRTRATQKGDADTEQPLDTPFVCMTVALLDNDIFSNVQVEHGKLVEDRGGIAVVGYALPGLKDSLGLDDTSLDVDLDLPEYLEITADVRDFALDPLYTIVTPELFYDLDTSALDLEEDLDEGTDALEEAMASLIEGSGALTGALRQLAAGGGTLGGGISALREALGGLPTGVTALSTGMHAIADGLDAASGAAQQLSDGSQQLSDASQGALGSVGVTRSAVQTAQSRVADLHTALDNLASTKDAIAAADDAVHRAHGAATDASEVLRSLNVDLKTQKEEVSEALSDGSADASTTVTHIDHASSTLDETLATLEGLPTDGLSEEQRQALETVKEQLKSLGQDLEGARSSAGDTATDLGHAREALDTLSVETPVQLSDDITALDDAAKSLAEREEEIEGSTEALDGADKAQEALEGATSSLDATEQLLQAVASGSGQLQTGTSSLAAVLAQASSGARELAAAVDQLAVTAPQLLDGVDQLGSGISQLTGALQATAEGSEQLSEGIATLDEEGIQELTDALRDMGTDIDDLRGRLDDLRDAAQGYDNFAGKTESQTSSVRFVYKTAQIG